MIYLILALVLAVVAGLGRQVTVFGRIEKGLGLFAHWRRLRIGLTSLSLLLAVVGIFTAPSTPGAVLLALILLLNAFSYFFEMPFFFPEIEHVERVPGSAARIGADTSVIGVTVEDTAVAYPIDHIVMPRHLVHDTIEETPVLISYCALCRSALAFRSTVEGRQLYFKVAGVWRRNMIVLDVQTQSIWQQATGECIYGQFKGRRLQLLSGENTTWHSWRKKHPQSEYAADFVEARRGVLSRERMLAALQWVTPRAGAPGFTDLAGVPKRETVFGVTVNGESRAYPRTALESDMAFRDRLGGVDLLLQYDGDADYLSATAADGEALIVEKHWWLGWKEFHPETTIWPQEKSKLL